MAVKLGFTTVDRFTGGWADWTADGRVREVDTAAAVSTLIAGGATPIDLRSSTDYDAGHLPGALNAEATTIPVDPSGSTGNAPFGTVLVLYGAGGGEADEYVAAGVLETAGYTNVVYYTGGWADWSANTE